MTQISLRICGIPAVVEVIDYIKVPGSFRHNEDSDLDYQGYVDYSYTICDRRGRPAPWLERKMAPSDLDNVHEAILLHYGSH